MEIQLNKVNNYPSRYAIGEVVYFHPGIQAMTATAGTAHALRARIEGVAFSESKVLYELAMDISPDPQTPHFYDAIAVASVDSTFVSSLADMQANEAGQELAQDRADVSAAQLAGMASASGATTPDAAIITRRFMAIAESIQEQKDELANVPVT